MTWPLTQTNKFKREYKRLDKPIQVLVDDALIEIQKNPSIGEPKKYDLEGISVYKFSFKGRLYLLAYDVNEDIRMILLLSVRSHENFYRELNN
jgi:mRNA-degrading endonuclease RelE of RelBE toxin-antitoxin system